MTDATATAIPSHRRMLKKNRQRHSWWLMLVLIPLIIFSASAITDDKIGKALMDWAGFCLIVTCVLGRTLCSVFIGGIKNTLVVRQGPFSIVRNPLYVFSFLGIVGIGLQSHRVTVLIILAAAFLTYYRNVVRGEEAYLTEKFGDAYLVYLKEVPRWFPKWSLWQEPEEITVRPYFIHRTMRDALVFFLAWPLFELLEYLQSNDILPYLITLP